MDYTSATEYNFQFDGLEKVMDDYLFWVAFGALFFSAMAWATATGSFKLLAETHHIVDVLANRVSEQDEVIARLERLAKTHQQTLLNLHDKLDDKANL